MSAIATAAAVISSWAIGIAPAGAKEKAPKEWDERIQQYVDFVEGQRGLDFKHPIKVLFLADKPFEKKLIGDEKPTKQDRQEAKQKAGQLRALGLIEGDVDLIGASKDLDASGTVGFYDSETEEMVVRGKDITDVETRVTVVHELTHALQDQHFDLDHLYDKAKTSSEGFALDALVEGDATNVEDAYVATLPQADQDAYYGTGPDQAETPEQALPEGVPPLLEDISAAPYVLGEPFAALLTEAGTDQLDRAFKKPPTTEEQIIDPIAWQQRQRAEHVATPKLKKGEKSRKDADEFGVLSLYLMLASRDDLRDALAAITGWSGDRYIGFQKDGHECVRADFATDDEKERGELTSALQTWAAGSSGGATVDAKGDLVELTACEVKGVAAPDPAVLERALFGVLANRLYLVDEGLAAGVPLQGAVCVADQVNTNAALDPIFDTLASGTAFEDLPQDQLDAIQGAYTDAFAACGVPQPEGT